ncbi:phosphatase PAP2 family protein [Calycomorphotria hydatis]|uniref:PAP2 superfamily protein n=1 Tax=Calycomorphotria hydatis TaxID=2528027 RepID=A0A517T6B8_9PLAN|nr:phosphatase PAP2 family protein [Calycomorphotria hydatis]QDT63919.1 PAP2 superfamily protein [Calycomorphotria hydatis]
MTPSDHTITNHLPAEAHDCTTADVSSDQFPPVMNLPLFWPVLALIGTTVLLTVTGLELQITSAFYDFEHQYWPLVGNEFWYIVDRCADEMAISILVMGFFAVCGQAVVKGKVYWRPIVFSTLIIVLVPGMLVNGVLKGAWSRPRPQHLEQFGGAVPYQPFWEMGNDPITMKSFPSGHAALAFLTLLPLFLCRRDQKKTAFAIIAVGLSFGAFVSASRVIQGLHFTNDILWSLGLTYCCAVAFRPFFLTIDRDPSREFWTFSRKKIQEEPGQTESAPAPLANAA